MKAGTAVLQEADALKEKDMEEGWNFSLRQKY